MNWNLSFDKATPFTLTYFYHLHGISIIKLAIFWEAWFSSLPIKLFEFFSHELYWSRSDMSKGVSSSSSYILIDVKSIAADIFDNTEPYNHFAPSDTSNNLQLHFFRLRCVTTDSENPHFNRNKSPQTLGWTDTMRREKIFLEINVLSHKYTMWDDIPLVSRNGVIFKQ